MMGLSSPGETYHPRSLAIYLLVIFLVALLLEQWVALFTMLVCLTAANRFFGNQATVKKLFVYGLPLFLLIIFFNVIFSQQGGEPLLVFTLPLLGQAIVYQEAFFFGLAMGLKLLVVLAVFMLMSVLLPAGRILDLIGGRGGQAALLMVMTLRILPRLYERAKRIRQVQIYRGVQPEGGTIKARAKSIGPFLSNLLRASLQESMNTAQILQARAFGSGPRSQYFQADWEKPDYLLSCWALGILAVGLWMAANSAVIAETIWLPALLVMALMLPMLLRRDEMNGID